MKSWWIALFVVLAVSDLHAAVNQSPSDSDLDGMPDQWELANGLNPCDRSDAVADTDRDGFSNLIEYLLGTGPQDASSHPTLADNRRKIIAYWPLATNSAEALGTNLAGQMKNGASFLGSAARFDGKDDYINFGNSSALSVTGSISYCLWMKPEQSCGTARVLGKFRTRGNNREYSVFIGPDDRLWTFFSDDGSPDHGHSILKATGRQMVKDRQWQHLGVTWDMSKGGEGVACYLNGAKRQLVDLVSSEIGSIHEGTADLTLGAYDIFNAGWNGCSREIVLNSFKGYMSQLVVCRGVLTDLEVREINLLGRQGDLKSWLDMDFDSDGMPDWWERSFLGDISQSADGDFDGDGVSNADEYRLGTSPADKDSITPVLGFPEGVISCGAGSSVSVPVMLYPAAAATVQVRVFVAGGSASNGTDFTFNNTVLTFTASQTNASVNVAILNNPASAGKTIILGLDQLRGPAVFGSTCTQVITIGNISIDDSDSDGLPDWWEQKYYGDSTNAAATADPYGTGWNNLQWFKRGGNPTKPKQYDAGNVLKLVVETPIR